MRKQLTYWSRIVTPLAVFALLLSGCFRPAGDSIQPTSVPATVDLSNQQPASNPTVISGTPAVTLLSPDTSGATTPTSAIPAITEVTVIPFQPTTTPTPVEGTLTATLQIITPGVSLDLMTPDTATPLPPDSSTQNGGVIAATTAEPLNMATLSGGATLVSGADCTYTVESGDSLYRIALTNDTTVDALKAANSDLQGDDPVLQPGQVLALPDCTPGQIRATTPALSNDSTAVPAAAASQAVYTVKPGDTLYAIASHFGVTINAIMRANNLSNPNTLSIGQTLVIPEKAH